MNTNSLLPRNSFQENIAYANDFGFDPSTVE
jgi:hypothetical protein